MHTGQGVNKSGTITYHCLGTPKLRKVNVTIYTVYKYTHQHSSVIMQTRLSHTLAPVGVRLQVLQVVFTSGM